MSTPRRTPAAAAYLGVSRSFLNKARGAGTGPAYRRAGRAVIYDQADLDKYRQANRVEPKSGPQHTNRNT